LPGPEHGARKRVLRVAGRWASALAAAAIVAAGCAEETVPPAEEDGGDRALAAEDYTGAESCRECHQEAYGVWEKSAHARAMTIATPETVRGDFEQDTTHTYDGQTHHAVRRGDSYYIRTAGLDGEVRMFPVLYTLGARQHETYLTKFADGRIQVLPIYWDLEENRWYDAAEGTLEFGRSFTPSDFLFWANPGRTWNDRCFDCHCSQMRKRYDLVTNTYDTAVGDLTINCEACHGPGGEHVRFWREALAKPQVGQQPDRSLVRLGRLPPDRQVEVCAQCHAKKSALRTGYRPGDDFLDFYEMNLLDDEESYWPDGLVKILAYPYLQFAGSKCFRMADLTCTGCHGDHGGPLPVDLVADPSDGGLCSRCHPTITADPTSHTFHKPGGTGNDCMACHMPQTFINFLTTTDHRLGSPVPEATARLGVPNACGQADCHADKSAEWASEWSRKWWGDYQEPRLARTQAVEWGREGDRRALPELMALLRNTDEDPLARGGAAGLLGRVKASESVDALIAAVGDPHPVVRWKAAVALGEIGDPRAIPALAGAVRDSVFSVRVRAAFALAVLGYVAPDSESRRAHDAALGDYESATRGLLADSPNAHVNVGRVYGLRREYQAAAQAYLRALRVNSGHIAAQSLLEEMGTEKDRFDKLSEMVSPHVESDPRLRVVLGIARVQRGLLEEGLALLEEAESDGVESELLQLGLGDAYRLQGRLADARTHYEKAIAIYPKLAGAYRGLSLIAYTRGDSAEGARRWAAFLANQVEGEAQGVIPGLSR